MNKKSVQRNDIIICAKKERVLKASVTQFLFRSLPGFTISLYANK